MQPRRKPMNPFKNNKIRSCWDSTSKKRWFSAVDICAALRASDYKKARNYWKWLKSKLQSGSQITITYQLKMQAADGKLRYTDVIDSEGIMQLIQACPSPKAKAFKIWIAKFKKKKTNAAKYLAAEIHRTRKIFEYKVGNLLKTIVKKEFQLFDNEEFEGFLKAA